MIPKIKVSRAALAGFLEDVDAKVAFLSGEWRQYNRLQRWGKLTRKILKHDPGMADLLQAKVLIIEAEKNMPRLKGEDGGLVGGSSDPVAVAGVGKERGRSRKKVT